MRDLWLCMLLRYDKQSTKRKIWENRREVSELLPDFRGQTEFSIRSSLCLSFFFILISCVPNCMLVLVHLNAAHVTAVHFSALINQTDARQSSGRERRVSLNLTPGLSSSTQVWNLFPFFHTNTVDYCSSHFLLWSTLVQTCHLSTFSTNYSTHLIFSFVRTPPISYA